MGADDTNVVTLLPINKIIPNANKAEGQIDTLENQEVSKDEESKVMKVNNDLATATVVGDIGTPNSFDRKDLVKNLQDLTSD